MKLTLIAVGKAKGGPEAVLCAEYIKRLPWPVGIIEVEEKRPLPATEKMVREGRKILNAIPGNALVVALDKGGQAHSSVAFAKALQSWQMGGHANITFVIGGAGGLAKDVLARADKTLSFGAMTWPHLLARVMLLEQLYRAHAINTGHPYHK